MKNFLKILPYKLALTAYLILFLSLTIIGWLLGYEWYGIKFSIVITLTILIIDLLALYKKYKKWQKN